MGGGGGWGGGGLGGYFPKGRVWSVSLCGVGGLALHGKAARVPPPTPFPPGQEGKRFPIQHAARVGGP